MPSELQLLDDSKRRESDLTLRLALVEIILLMCGTLEGRDELRRFKAYDVIKKLHLQERDEDVQEMIERAVNMLMRDEDDGTAQVMSETPPVPPQMEVEEEVKVLEPIQKKQKVVLPPNPDMIIDHLI